MVDLSNILGQGSPGQAVEAWYEANQEPRNYLGLSECGHECSRYLWYQHHGHPSIPIEGRILRLFRLGENIETQAAIDLQSAGYLLHSRQKEVSFEHRDIRLVGHIDGIIEGLIESNQPHLWECKSASHQQFAKLLKAGYEKWNEKYKAQVHVYMLGLKLKRALVWVENKDTSEVYAERVKLDKEYAVNLLQSVFNAISQLTEPERACPTMSWFKASWCGFRGICWK